MSSVETTNEARVSIILNCTTVPYRGLDERGVPAAEVAVEYGPLRECVVHVVAAQVELESKV
jgi:hypothetical protein